MVVFINRLNTRLKIVTTLFLFLTPVAQATCARLFDGSTYVGCRVFNEEKEMGFDSDRISHDQCFNHCSCLESLLGGYPSAAPHPNYFLASSLYRDLNQLHYNAGKPRGVEISNAKHVIGDCHILNPRADLQDSTSGTYLNIEILEENRLRLNPQKNYAREVTQVSKDGHWVETTTPIGERHFFRVLERDQEGELKSLREVAFDQTPFVTPAESPSVQPPIDRVKSLTGSYPEAAASKEKLESLQHMLLNKKHQSVTRQLRIINTIQGSDKVTPALQQAYEDITYGMLRKIVFKQSLVAYDLENWHRQISSVIEHDDTLFNRMNASIVRGTTRREEEKNRD